MNTSIETPVLGPVTMLPINGGVAAHSPVSTALSMAARRLGAVTLFSDAKSKKNDVVLRFVNADDRMLGK